MTVPRIRTLRWTERHTAANIIATSLHPSSLAEWLIPDINHRHPVLAAVAEIWVEHALFFGEVHTTDDLTAVTIGLHRQRPLPPPTNYPQRLAAAANSYTQRFLTLDHILDTCRPTKLHHLTVLAIPPNSQHNLDQTMLRHYLTRIDRTALPAWAEIPVRHRALFTRHGYHPHTDIHLPDGPTLLGMHRPPPATKRRPATPTPNRGQLSPPAPTATVNPR